MSSRNSLINARSRRIDGAVKETAREEAARKKAAEDKAKK